MFEQIDGLSPVGQDFIWLAEYRDGAHLAEFDFVTQEENSFYDIERNRLHRFGLVGHGHKFYFEQDGLFHINGREYQVTYKVGDIEYLLSGSPQNPYNDIITYKDAEAVGLANFNLQGGDLASRITQFNVGYKTTIIEEDVTFSFKMLCKVPSASPIYFNFRLVADK